MDIFQRRRRVAAASDWQLWIFKYWKTQHFPKLMSGMVWTKKYRITSSNAHKVLICQKNFETLTENLFVKNKKCSNTTKEALNHGKKIRAYCKENLYWCYEIQIETCFS